MASMEPHLNPVGIRLGTGMLMWALTAINGVVVWHSFSGIAPPAHLLGWAGLVGAHVGFWLCANLGVMLWPLRAANIRNWSIVAVLVVNWAILDILYIVWMLMPYGAAEMRVAVALFCVASIAAILFALPEFKWSNRLCIISVMGSLMIMMARQPGQSTPFLLPFCLIYSVAMLAQSNMVRDNLQGNRTARLEAERQQEARTRFLASASHDLGQPLQSARLFFDQVLRSGDPSVRAHAVEEAKGAFAMMARQLDQMLLHLRLETGAVEARLVTLSAGAQISAVASLAEAEAQLAGVEIIAVPSGLAVLGDRSLIERALSNLAHNAIRHAKARRLLIGARRHGANVRFWVIDDGVGIAGADLPRLFDDYVQGSDHGDEVRGGFGLGLASVRRMAVLIGGSAGLDTRWKRGSAFFLEVPGGDHSGASSLSIRKLP